MTKCLFTQSSPSSYSLRATIGLFLRVRCLLISQVNMHVSWQVTVKQAAVKGTRSASEINQVRSSGMLGITK